MELDKLKKRLAQSFQHQPYVIAVLLYGSYAKGLAKSDSDIDIAVLYEPTAVPDPMKLFELKQDLVEKLEKEVDLVCLNATSIILASQIYKYHLPILINDQKKLAQYFMYLISDYAELKELRRPMEEKILERRDRHGS